jgi:hypothetical protein
MNDASQDDDRRVRIIVPRKDNKGKKQLRAIKEFDSFLSLPATKVILDQVLTGIIENLPAVLRSNKAASSIVQIQSNRYEIYAQCEKKSSVVFDWLCQETCTKGAKDANECFTSPSEVKDAILSYAKQQAKRDKRIGGRNKKMNYIFDNFSLIVNYGLVGAQIPHIDTLLPNFQFGLVMTDESPVTIAYRATNQIKSVKDIREHAWTDLPLSLETAMEKNRKLVERLINFGNVLSPELEPDSNIDSTNSHPGGTLLALPGSEVHAGPECEKYRALLFFTACPHNDIKKKYDADTQFYASLLCCEFISQLWEKISRADRMYLLRRLVQYIEQTQHKGLEQYTSDDILGTFLRVAVHGETMEQTSRYYKRFSNRKSTLEDYIQYFATQEHPICKRRTKQNTKRKKVTSSTPSIHQVTSIQSKPTLSGSPSNRVASNTIRATQTSAKNCVNNITALVESTRSSRNRNITKQLHLLSTAHPSDKAQAIVSPLHYCQKKKAYYDTLDDKKVGYRSPRVNTRSMQSNVDSYDFVDVHALSAETCLQRPSKRAKCGVYMSDFPLMEYFIRLVPELTILFTVLCLMCFSWLSCNI